MESGSRRISHFSPLHPSSEHPFLPETVLWKRTADNLLDKCRNRTPTPPAGGGPARPGIRTGSRPRQGDTMPQRFPQPSEEDDPPARRHSAHPPHDHPLVTVRASRHPALIALPPADLPSPPQRPLGR